MDNPTLEYHLDRSVQLAALRAACDLLITTFESARDPTLVPHGMPTYELTRAVVQVEALIPVTVGQNAMYKTDEVRIIGSSGSYFSFVYIGGFGTPHRDFRDRFKPVSAGPPNTPDYWWLVPGAKYRIPTSGLWTVIKVSGDLVHGKMGRETAHHTLEEVQHVILRRQLAKR